MKVSVIVAVYNGERYLQRCVESLLAQTYRDVEYVFVDDASTDGSLPLLRDLIAHSPRRDNVLLLSNDHNCGCNVTRYRGMKAATGDYMIHVDCDDYVDPRFIEKLSTVAVDGNNDVVACEILYDYGNRTVRHEIAPVADSRDFLCKILSGQMHASLCNKLIRSKIITEHDLYPAEGITLGEDKYVVVRALHYASRVAVVNEPLYIYNKTNENSFTSQSKARVVPSFLKLTRSIIEFFDDKNVDDDIRQAIAHHKALVLGHILLYGKHEDAYTETFGDVTLRDIITHPVAPLHYKIACVASKLKLSFLVKAIAASIRAVKG